MVSIPSSLVGFWGFHPYIHLFFFRKLFVTCIYMSAVRCSVNANCNWHWKIAHANPCGRNTKNNHVKASAIHRLIEWRSQISAEQEDRQWRRKRQSTTGCRDSRPKQRKVEKLRGRDCAKHATQTASERQATLQRKSMWRKGNETSEEREMRLEWMRDKQAVENSEETEDYSKDQPARKVSS